MQGQIGPYKIESEIGRGGMGVVYLATDTRLDRAVAIKALPPELASDPVRLERFEREAKTLASLSHPNLAGIHGVEEQDGARYLVLEYVDGETLADRLDRGPLPIEDAIELGVQIAAGIEAAHEAGVIHRDLKPANIKITSEGVAKVLDFGLARTDESGHSSSGGLDSPTMTTPQPQHSPTIEGAILGTAAYMSPEQARGRRVDKRTDIWSFGIVLYEMLVGASPFHGETATDSIGAVLHKDIDLSALPEATPSNVRRALGRCLQRDRSHRYHDIADSRLELLSECNETAAVLAQATKPSRRLWTLTGWAVALVAIVGLLLLTTLFEREPVGVQRLDMDIVPRAGLELARLTTPPRISPDSSKLAYMVHFEGEAESRIAIRDLHTGEERILRGPRQPRHPVWTRDGSAIVYTTERGAEKVDVHGGRPRLISPLSNFTRNAPGGIDHSGRFVFSRMRGSLLGVEPGSDESVELIDPIPGREGDWAMSPSFLPDGEHVLFSNQDDVTADSGLYIGSIADGSSRRLLPFETSCVFVEPDIVVYWQEGDLYARRFDLDSLRFVGEAVLVAETVLHRPWPLFGLFDANPEILAFIQNDSDGASDMMTVFNFETGEETPLGVEGSLWSPEISPDGTRLAYDRTVDATAGDIVVLDLDTGHETMLSRDEANESIPIWSPDGEEIFFFRGPDIYRVPSDASRSPVLVYSSSASCQPQAVSPDGRTLLFAEGESREWTMLLDLQTGDVRQANVNDPNPVYGRGFSTDGHWLIYITEDNNVERSFAARLDGTGEPIQLTPGYGVVINIAGEWAYIRTRSDLVRVHLQPIDGELHVSEPERVVPMQGLGHVAGTPDGSKLIIIRPKQPLKGGSIRVVNNWIPESLR